jgi:predicted RNase H-like HicB family nuclease
MKHIKVMIEWSGDNFSAGTGKINGAVMATGKTPEQVKKNFEDAFDFHIKNSLKDGDTLPAYIIKKQYQFDFELGASTNKNIDNGHKN